MLIHQGLNDRWVRPRSWRRVRAGHYALTLREPLGKRWLAEIVFYPLPATLRGKEISVRCQGRRVPTQRAGGQLAILVEDLAPHEERVYSLQVLAPAVAAPGATTEIKLRRQGALAIFTNGLIELKLPVSAGDRREIPGPILAVRRGRGPWLGRGRLESSLPVRGITTRLIEQGELWATAEVRYRFAGGYSYRVRLKLRPREEVCEVTEESTLPVRLWPAPRPYREIGSLRRSFWNQPPADLAKPCTRPCPTSNFLFEVGPGLRADRLVTHSTSAWEIMDLPLAPTAVGVKTYTALRPALPFIDGGWLGVYRNGADDLLGVASVDIAHWRAPDDRVHPAHRTPGVNAEVLLVDSRAGTHFRFPVENLSRRWLLVLASRAASVGLGAKTKPAGKPVRLEPDSASPVWAWRVRRGDLRLDKVKDWIVAWPDAGAAHPRVLCRRREFAAIRQKMKTVPEFRRYHDRYKRWRAADRYVLTGEPARLAEIEAATHARELVEGILQRGYTGPCYAIGLSRPLRRYALACDMVWDSFTPAEKREARRVCALAGYIMTDGDWWQFAYRPNETTYLPNFNSDVYTCAGLIGLFLSDHPCSAVWTRQCVERLDIELKYYVRRDGTGEENFGHYFLSTWMMLYFPAFWALRQGGVKDYSRDPRVLASARFIVNVMGPPDRRDEGRRMIPPIGHHPYFRKVFPVVDWLATFVRSADPELAGHLKWVWRAFGSPVGNFADHSGPKASPLTRHYLFHDPTIRPIAPALGSYNLPHVGAVLRSHDASGQGSFLFLKAGRVHSHHDEDEGSIHYFGRGVPLALDGLPIQNGAKADEHNAVTFTKPGQPTGLVAAFKTTPIADYVRARIAPRAFCCDANYVDGTHRSGWDREIVLVKAPRPGDSEYVVIKDSVVGPEACQWNLDVLSGKPLRTGAGRVWFPGQRAFNMGLEVIIVEPMNPRVRIAPGTVNPRLLDPRLRRQLSEYDVSWPITEHWLLHLPAAPGTTFLVILFPRRASEPPPAVEYCAREETVAIRHAAGRDLVFLRPNPMVGTSLAGVLFQGRAGIVVERGGRRRVQPLDAVTMRVTDSLGGGYKIL